MSEVYRYERKFAVEQLDLHQVRALVHRHPALFREAYPPRYVNNIYLDTPWLGSYFDNVHGARTRTKFRIRWYGELAGEIANPVLEFKKKDGLVGSKDHYPLQPFVLDRELSAQAVLDVMEASGLPGPAMMSVSECEPALINRYLRYYLVSRDARFRLTIDTELTYYRPGRLQNSFLCSWRDRNRVIVEVKYLPAEETSAHFVTSWFPFRMTRNSKYVQGIESVYALPGF